MKRISFGVSKRLPTEAEAIASRGEYLRGLSTMLGELRFDCSSSGDDRGSSYTDAGGTSVRHYSQISGNAHRNLFSIDSPLDDEANDVAVAIKGFSRDLGYS